MCINHVCPFFLQHFGRLGVYLCTEFDAENWKFNNDKIHKESK